MRLFFAIELGESLLDLIERETTALVAEAPELSWTSREKRHLTLKFLGDVPDDAATRLAEAATQVAGRHRPIEMAIHEVGAFPNFRRARVVWLGVEQEPRLELLHHDLEIACEQVGFEVEGRPFRPHITLARIRSPLPGERARGLARVARTVRLRATEMVEGITLFQSILAPSGAQYRRIHVATLGGR
jgi:2'-5' RNA ligase